MDRRRAGGTEEERIYIYGEEGERANGEKARDRRTDSRRSCMYSIKSLTNKYEPKLKKTSIYAGNCCVH